MEWVSSKNWKRIWYGTGTGYSQVQVMGRVMVSSSRQVRAGPGCVFPERHSGGVKRKSKVIRYEAERGRVA
jgi:hypothetical protein